MSEKHFKYKFLFKLDYSNTCLLNIFGLVIYNENIGGEGAKKQDLGQVKF